MATRSLADFYGQEVTCDGTVGEQSRLESHVGRQVGPPPKVCLTKQPHAILCLRKIR